MMMMNNLFTAAQWEELEQQALIYKYMVSGVPVPTDLILSVRRSLYNSSFSSSSSSSSSLLSNQPTLGVWEGSFQYNQLYQMGGSGCRRTDGKKWRCSKEAYPDSKYCERHMHRGRNRSRKPVEFSSSSSSSSTANVSSSPSTTISKSISTSDHHAYPPFSSDHNNQTHYSSSRPPIHTNFMDSSSYSHQTPLKDYRSLSFYLFLCVYFCVFIRDSSYVNIIRIYRYLQGMKDLGEDERTAYFQLNDPYTTTQKMAAAAAAAAAASSSSSDHHNYSHFNFQNLNDQFKEQKDKEEQSAQGQHCFVMGTDFIKSSEETTNTKPCIQTDTKVDQTTHTHTHHKQPFHHFFSPPKTTPNHDPGWVEVDQHQHQHQHQHHQHLTNPPKSPLSTQDLFQSKPRPYW
ncbi:Glutamine-Leucine-Glutamine, QLQ [Cynara cardunculus var. scolymus]|uniref:Growth-regulating factor n=1 Tax=Cynara cardunculus var. scolymus TaxID=59895 RepID=A0A103YB65_CYNCS|nr:Glutamine-Leucine-Glutamine, QLQ [Cynara cardunculus var. scolymus]